MTLSRTGDLDLHPAGDTLNGSVDVSGVEDLLDPGQDFDGRTRGDVRGAYTGPAEPSSWSLVLDFKP